MSDHGLRTTGKHTGNFGRAKVQGKRESLDLSPSILKKDNLRIPSQEEAFAKLLQAYEMASDPKTRKVLAEMIKSKRATAISTRKVAQEREENYWDMVKRTR